MRNYKRMEKRRVLFTIGVTYDTPLEKQKQIPGVIKEIIEAIPDTAFDRRFFPRMRISARTSRSCIT